MSNVNWDALSVFFVCVWAPQTNKVLGIQRTIFYFFLQLHQEHADADRWAWWNLKISMCDRCLSELSPVCLSDVNNIVLPSSHTHTHTGEYWELIQLKAWAIIQPRSSRTQTHVECGCYRNTLEAQLTRFQKHCVLSWACAGWVSEVWRGEKQSGVSCRYSSRRVWLSTHPRPRGGFTLIRDHVGSKQFIGGKDSRIWRKITKKMPS